MLRNDAGQSAAGPSHVFITFGRWFILVLSYFLLAFSQVQRCREGGSCPIAGLLQLGEREGVGMRTLASN